MTSTDDLRARPSAMRTELIEKRRRDAIEPDHPLLTAIIDAPPERGEGSGDLTDARD